MEQNVDELILVADDDHVMRVYLRDVLNKAGFRVITASNGKAAVEMYSSRRPDIMILDINMPEKDGFQVCREIRLEPNGSLAPIFMVTSVDDEESIQQAFEAGATDFITKPVKEGILIQRVRYMLRAVRNTKNAEKKIHHLAYFDSLTGLPNRRMLQDRLNHALAIAHRENRRVCLLFLDLDKFKDVNDTQGHHFGDSLLRAVATRLADNMRESDTLARVGGDEFVIILSTVGDQEGASTAARRIMSLFSQPFEIEGRLTHSSASIGIAMYPDDGLDFETLLKCADNAMYHAKKQGRSSYRFYTTEIHQKMMQRVAIENGLRYGLERNEFFLQYQPQWDLKTAEISGVEVLLRWQSRDFGLIPPAEFIALTEDSGLIYELGEWILRTACLQVRQCCLTRQKPFTVAVNISGQQLRQPDFVAMVERIFFETGVDAAFIEFEFAENVLMDHADNNIQILRRLRTMGIQLSMDDFGTGYLSLSFMKNFPFDKIKIDRSFINEITEGADNLKIVKAIITLAESFNLRVIAKGVENSEQLEILRKLGCHGVQGFYLAKPMHLECLTEMLGCRRLLNNCSADAPIAEV
jgi:diguanylate cyclase (GGDEF)-like protein